MNWTPIALIAAPVTGAAEALLWLMPARMTVPQFDRLSAFIPDKEGKVPAVDYLEKSGR
ncbi:hypothetical protein [Hyphomicrobium sp.]|uniref:hypothetical protein n=1 Tax=Hyphomicrobium sp. TaxID=82 RepID=UPI0025B9AD79|nr:hypothetical protein [Hyphomicrobium sp.]